MVIRFCELGLQPGDDDSVKRQCLAKIDIILRSARMECQPYQDLLCKIAKRENVAPFYSYLSTAPDK